MLTLNVVSISEASELFLAGRVPDVELEGPPVGVENEGVHLYPQSRHVLLLELPRQMALDECGLSNSAIANKHQLNTVQHAYFYLKP